MERLVSIRANSVVQGASAHLANPGHWVSALLFLLSALFLSADLLPAFDDISPWDESSYINSGRRLVDEGFLRIFSWSPLAMAVYGLAYLPFQESPHWFVNTAVGGRIIFFVLFWFGMYMCARRLAPVVNPNWVMVMAAIWISLIPLLGNASDALFMAMSALALWKLLDYRSERRLKHVVWASTFVGLGALARNDGLVLFFSLLILIAAFTRGGGVGENLLSRVGRLAIAAILPFTVIVGAYLLAYGVVTGRYELGTAARTYTTFMDGHTRTYPERYVEGTAGTRGMTDVADIYGTMDENSSSVFNAIRRNPGAFSDRLFRQLRALPRVFTSTYGGEFALVLLFLVGRGALHLWRTRQGRWLIPLAIVWHLHLLAYTATFWSNRSLQFPFVLMMVIGAIGAAALLSNIQDWRERGAALLVLGAIAVASVSLDADRGSVAVPAILFTGLLIYTLAQRFSPTLLTEGPFMILLVIATCVAVVAAQDNASKSHFPLTSGESPAIPALEYMASGIEEGSVIGVYGLKMPYAARMDQRQLPTDVSVLKDVEHWLESNNIEAVYLSPLYKENAPNAWQILMSESGPGKPLSPGYSDPTSDTYVLLPSPTR